MNTHTITECPTHGDTLTGEPFGPRIKRVEGEYVRVVLAGTCPTCDQNMAIDYREGTL